MDPKCYLIVDFNCYFYQIFRVQSSLAVIRCPWWNMMVLTESKWERRLALCAQLWFFTTTMG